MLFSPDADPEFVEKMKKKMNDFNKKINHINLLQEEFGPQKAVELVFGKKNTKDKPIDQD